LRVLKALNEQVAARRCLDPAQVSAAVDALLDESVEAQVKADFLCSLALKGETVEEIACFAEALRGRAVHPPIDEQTRGRTILDVCGTGGDRLNTFNISTTVAIVCAAAGVPVAKHGNRAVTSQSGSADVLEALGIRIDLGPEEAAASLRERNFAFFFAPRFHPAFKHIAAARKLCADKGQRTIFNFLGPLLNPAAPAAQLVGVPRPELCEPLGRVLQQLGAERGMVVSGEVAEKPGAYLDELSTLGTNHICEFYQERGFASSKLELEHFPLQRAGLADLSGGVKKTGARIVREILEGKDKGPRRDAVLLNAGAALMVARAAQSITAGWASAAAVIDSGRAGDKLKELAG
jgi:anthranilate phosphoribosyltransferase